MTSLSDVGKIFRGGERRLSYLFPDKSKPSFSSKGSKVEPMPRNLLTSNGRDLTLLWVENEKSTLVCKHPKK